MKLDWSEAREVISGRGNRHTAKLVWRVGESKTPADMREYIALIQKGCVEVLAALEEWEGEQEE